MLPNNSTLLIVEDDPGVLEVITDVLGHGVYSIMTANNGAKGLEYILNSNPTAVLTDITMPQMNGIEMVKKVREANLETPVVIMTGYSNTEHNLAAIKYGVFDLIEKPFSNEKLLNVVSQAIQFGIKMQAFEKEWDHFTKTNSFYGQMTDDLRVTKRQMMKMKYLNDRKVA